MSNEISCDLVVIGAGSAGFGTAYSAARLGARVVLVEKGPAIGGTAVHAGVHNWEPGVGNTGLPFEIWQRLREVPGAIGITRVARHIRLPADGEAPFPGGEYVVDPALHYVDSLRRHVGAGPIDVWKDEAFCRNVLHAVVFEPDAYQRMLEQMLSEPGRCQVRVSTGFVSVRCDAGEIRDLKLSDGTLLKARYFCDCTGDGLLAQAAGCETMNGREGRHQFGERSAPESPTTETNGVSLIYRLTPTTTTAIEPLPSDVPDACWWAAHYPSVFGVRYPCGDYCFNMLPTMSGAEFRRLTPTAAMDECRHRVRSHWHHVQVAHPEFRRYRLAWIAPRLGVREGPRVLGQYVLTENDLLGRTRIDDVVCLADHPPDVHGHATATAQVRYPYAIPFRCLMARDVANLLVAGRCASFSSIAASGCRLSRTMLQAGSRNRHGAGRGRGRACDSPAVRAAQGVSAPATRSARVPHARRTPCLPRGRTSSCTRTRRELNAHTHPQAGHGGGHCLPTLPRTPLRSVRERRGTQRRSPGRTGPRRRDESPPRHDRTRGRRGRGARNAWRRSCQ